MTLLIYAYFIGQQLMIGMAEYDTLERCTKQGLPQVEIEYPGAGASCVVVRNTSPAAVD